MSSPTIHNPATESLESSLREEIDRLTVRNGELERANRELERFTFVASHDLHEPLRAITAYAQLLAKRCDGMLDAEAARCVRSIVDSTTRMRALLADLLTYTRVGAVRDQCRETADLNSVLDAVMRNLKAAIDESRASITWDPLPVLRARASDFIPLFQDLLSNAIKYRGDSLPRIRISMRRENSQLRFAVADNGMGIDPAHHRQIFEPFKRLHGRNIPGTGLGLTICQRVIQQYGGRIWVESKPGEGSTFVFTLPDISIR